MKIKAKGKEQHIARVDGQEGEGGRIPTPRARLGRSLITREGRGVAIVDCWSVLYEARS